MLNRFLEKSRLYFFLRGRWLPRPNTQHDDVSGKPSTPFLPPSSFSSSRYFLLFIKFPLLLIITYLIVVDFFLSSSQLPSSSSSSFSPSSSSLKTSRLLTSQSSSSSLRKLTKEIPIPKTSSPSCRYSYEIEQTIVHPVALGFTCFDNLYLFQGRPSVFLKTDGSSIDISLAEYLKSSEPGFKEGPITELTNEEVAIMTKEGPLPTLNSAQLLLDWKDKFHLSHFSHFAQGLTSSVFMEAYSHLPPAEAVICVNCNANVNTKNGLNEVITRSLFNGAPLLRSDDFNNTSSSVSSLWGREQWCHRQPGPLPAGHVPQNGLHIARACLSDIKTSHKSKLTYEQNNVNAQLVLTVTSSLQRDMDAVLNRLRTSEEVVKKDTLFPNDVQDVLGESVRNILDMPSSIDNPLIVVVKRVSSSTDQKTTTTYRTFNDDSFFSLVELAKSFSNRVLAIAFEFVSHVQLLHLLTRTDILIGAHGSALSHALWTQRGSGVLEIFPHWTKKDTSGSIIAEGTGWRNDISFLTHIKGNIYRAMDASLGSQIPINHKISDSPDELNVDNIILNMSAVNAELSNLVTKWKWVRKEETRGKHVDMTKQWHPKWNHDVKLNGLVL